MSKYTVDDVINMYKKVQRTKGKEAYRYVSEVFEQIEGPYKESYLKEKPKGSASQSWIKFKGGVLEQLLQYMITDSIEELGLKVVNGK